KRHHRALIVSNVKLADIFCLSAIVALRLDVDLPLSAKSDEIGDKVATHESLQRLISIPDRRSFLHDLFAIHVCEQLGHTRKRSSAEPCKFRASPRFS